MLDTVRLALGRPTSRQTFHECRHCGTSLPSAHAACPSCDSTEVATYEL